MPKAELHVHAEGTREPEMMFEMAARNGVWLQYGSVTDVRDAYDFPDLYYGASRVLVHERDFYGLALAYLSRAASQAVRRAEIFFDPQAHTDRGVALKTVIMGLHRTLLEGQRRFGIFWHLILCFLRHLSAEAAVKTLRRALP
jgi:adenosine deaminase